MRRAVCKIIVAQTSRRSISGCAHMTRYSCKSTGKPESAALISVYKYNNNCSYYVPVPFSDIRLKTRSLSIAFPNRTRSGIKSPTIMQSHILIKMSPGRVRLPPGDAMRRQERVASFCSLASSKAARDVDQADGCRPDRFLFGRHRAARGNLAGRPANGRDARTDAGRSKDLCRALTSIAIDRRR